ncbi:hypothetical protein [Microbacterium sp.]|uniref:hypothetical protein n=1 Tax=Microbacterium sp. TaxID=51671 RepID=UPI003C758E35
MATTTADLLTLIDAYAAASAAREEAREYASWAFADAHRAMLTARADVTAALGINPDVVPPLTDATTVLAEDAIAADAAWSARIDAVLAGGAL